MYARLVNLLSAISFAVLVCARSTPPRQQVARQSGTYTIQNLYRNTDFFNYWSFFDSPDPTGGYVNYLNSQAAQAAGLAYVDGNGAFVMRIDSWSDVPVGGNRNAVRIVSNCNYSSGLFILDIATMPVGCGTWPSFWTVGPNWPYAGEIDIVEGVNDQTQNQMTLHSGTSNACTINTAANGTFTGHVLGKNCYSTQTADAGCGIDDPNPTSFGYGFNQAQGGVFAMLWDPANGISMWHFTRAKIPADIKNQSPTPSKWGTPAGFWSAQTCDISANFYQNVMVIDTTICGGWASSNYPSSGCPGTCEEIVANATNFEGAMWTINYLAVYQLNQ